MLRQCTGSCRHTVGFGLLLATCSRTSNWRLLNRTWEERRGVKSEEEDEDPEPNEIFDLAQSHPINLVMHSKREDKRLFWRFKSQWYCSTTQNSASNSQFALYFVSSDSVS
ncbi:hypothetical protein BDV34DRAFT_194539 [Aspergillus parasiticus]|uniref:Uncharacterized protein n=1 Tax=Aspergillus parasiticus TaxID=5067 RepID=A0A5N6DNS2_ASPPA|nr:hypothetical protein BDV34DRAFT_194539 [Aspergillus parasiticus]